MKIFIDTNIFIDVFLKRDYELEETIKIFDLAKVGKIELYLSSISLNNIHYICKKRAKEKEVRQYLDYILNNFTVIHTNDYMFQESINLSINDFEDWIQYISAIEYNCKVIVTRNKKDFPKEKIKVLSPKKAFELISSV